jgi:putative transposase
MKQDFPDVSRERLCRLFGKSRRAIYDYQQRLQEEKFSEDIILQLVMQIRGQLPRLGTRKLHYKLQPLLKEHAISIGRDALFELLQAHKLLIRQRKRKVVTTDSRHWMRKYSNLTGTLVIDRPEQLWVSDITYIRLSNQWAYLSLVTDAYSRKIMGYCLRTDMSVAGCLQALQMALNNRQYPHEPLIHHSDRGSQYCSAAYTQLLNDTHIAVSMTENGDPYENALAERVNGIIKSEFNLHESRLGFEATCDLITSSIDAYNHIRPHSSCDLLTPQQAHQQHGPLLKRWKNYHSRDIITPVIYEVSNNEYESKTEAARLPLTEQAPASVLRTVQVKPYL